MLITIMNYVIIRSYVALELQKYDNNNVRSIFIHYIGNLLIYLFRNRIRNIQNLIEFK